MGFSRLRKQLFVILLLAVLAAPLLSISLAFFLLNLPADVMRWAFGSPTPFFTFEEFGAMPQGFIGHLFMIFFYVALAYLLSWFGNLRKDASPVSWKEAISPTFRKRVGIVLILFFLLSAARIAFRLTLAA